MNIIELEQGSPSWLSWRQGKRMASESPAVTRRSPYQKWEALREVKRGTAKNFSTAAMQHGHTYEPIARAWAMAEIGIICSPVVIEDGEYGASLDGFDGDSVLEIKCPSSGRKSDTWQLAEKGLIRPDYDDQLVHQLAVSGAKIGYFTVFDADSNKGLVIERQPDADSWKSITKAWDEFWAWSLTDEPDPIKNIRSDAEWFQAAQLFAANKRKSDEFSLVAEKYRQTLIELAGADSAEGAGVRVTKSFTAGAIDYKAATKDLSIDFELYRKAGSPRNTINLI